MTRTAIHQVLPVLAARDAVGHHTAALRDLIRSLGVESEIYTPDRHDDALVDARHPDDLGESDGRTWLLYHASTDSHLAGWLLDRPEPLLLDYHNITPAEMFAPWEPLVGARLVEARRQLGLLLAHADTVVADSSYNASELRRLGRDDARVAPILFDPSHSGADPDPTTLERLRTTRGAVWLFVGRLAPNKAQHDVIAAFAAYRTLVDPDARLCLVGGSSSDRYLRALRDYVDDLGLADRVDMPGAVSAGELAAYFDAADVFVCLSDHEGFCVPLLEAMQHGVPIVAFESSAVPETLGDAGLLLPEKSPALVAAAVARVVDDASLREQLVRSGQVRLDELASDSARQTWIEVLEGVLSGRRTQARA